MALTLHWTRDPRFRHLRRAPTWYDRDPGPFWTPRPSARMEKQAAEERQREWRTIGDEGYDEEALAEAYCWPCGVYARIMERIRRAFRGKDAIDLPEQPWLNYHCLWFCCCCPFYGLLIGKLQGMVRMIYGIDGDDGADFADGCFCPCNTLVRSEREIIDRETLFGRVKDRNTPAYSISDPYRPPSPMDSRFGSSSSSSRPELDTIPEVPSRERSVRRPQYPDIHSISVDPVASSDPTQVAPTHQLRQDPAAKTIAGQQDPIHELKDDPVPAGQKPMARPVRVDHAHSLQDDPVVSQGIAPAPHHLHQDQTTAHHAPKDHSHTLQDDHMAPANRFLSLGRLFRSGQADAAPAAQSHSHHHTASGTHERTHHQKDQLGMEHREAKHHEHDRKKTGGHAHETVPQPTAVRAHELRDDPVMAMPHQGPIKPHTLSQDHTVPVQHATHRPHHLQEDQ